MAYSCRCTSMSKMSQKFKISALESVIDHIYNDARGKSLNPHELAHRWDTFTGR